MKTLHFSIERHTKVMCLKTGGKHEVGDSSDVSYAFSGW